MRLRLVSVLIVPLWNWNRCKIDGKLKSKKVLIVPLWNWNEIKDILSENECLVLIVPLWNWNMSAISKIIKRSFCSNCTFMELKWRTSLTRCSRALVLIVPLWNWNDLTSFLIVFPTCSNCTFMELKSRILSDTSRRLTEF